jgi:hypothetical protein
LQSCGDDVLIRRRPRVNWIGFSEATGSRKQAFFGTDSLQCSALGIHDHCQLSPCRLRLRTAHRISLYFGIATRAACEANARRSRELSDPDELDDPFYLVAFAIAWIFAVRIVERREQVKRTPRRLRLPALAAELVGRRVDVIVTPSSIPTIQALLALLVRIADGGFGHRAATRSRHRQHE